MVGQTLCFESGGLHPFPKDRRTTDFGDMDSTRILECSSEFRRDHSLTHSLWNHVLTVKLAALLGPPVAKSAPVLLAPYSAHTCVQGLQMCCMVCASQGSTLLSPLNDKSLCTFQTLLPSCNLRCRWIRLAGDDDNNTPVLTWQAGYPRHQPRHVCIKVQDIAKCKRNVKRDITYLLSPKCADNIAFRTM
jgi:hypothetical protein